jgi:hypothetical protein
MWDDLHFGFHDLELLSESENRKEYRCGCYHKKAHRSAVWSFVPVCRPHKAEAAKRFKSLPLYKKAISYGFFGFLIVLCVAALFMIWMLIKNAFLR